MDRYSDSEVLNAGRGCWLQLLAPAQLIGAHLRVSDVVEHIEGSVI